MNVCEEKDVYPQRTRNQLSYCFTPKHHGAGSRTDARWLPDLPRPEEFAIFEMADANQLRDDDGNLYGLRIRQTGPKRELLEVGVRHELIARFWNEENQAHWHGHPLWPVAEGGPENRRDQKFRPPNHVFERMIQANLVTKMQAGRLKTGRHLRNL